ncbi:MULTISPECIES: hypothetical protein [Lelliottia]|uniref:Uncharacterized protein n=1 Tax=Lelliottia wanjuensis TaxID=3050585 RepID=A0AAP4D3J1_9ENTR|nr:MULTISPECIES: hypothetical protein [unclassified Lelliottia]MDK9363689.1 hypothetical protein [Lelliottia sp. V106_12]MDK9587543.1 hypothetical protein [Lelliottia sp. V86_10]MDK9619172.1 hypothetical protein [Lelliottia sp. V106_9]
MNKNFLLLISRWIKGECPLWVTCWLTGVIPYMMLLQFHLSILHVFFEHTIQFHTANLLLRIDEVVFLIYIPICLVAIANNAIKYKGFHLWRFFTFLFFAKGCEIYFNFIMGKWPLG